MANNNATTNLKLTLPVEEDINWAGTINENFRKIDNAVGEIENKYTTLVNTNIDNAAIFIDDEATAVNFYNVTNTEQLILGNIKASGFDPVGNAIGSDQYVNFTKGRCFYVYCGLDDNASYKGNESNTAPYNMNWANGDIMVFDKEYRNGQYQISFRKMPQVLGKKYLNQHMTAHYFQGPTKDNWYTYEFNNIASTRPPTQGAWKDAEQFPNINCDLYYCDNYGTNWEKIITNYTIIQDHNSNIVKLKVYCDQDLGSYQGILAVLYYRV